MEQPNYSALIEKWKPVLDEESAGEIKDNHRRSVTATLLENQEKAIAEQNAQGMLFEAAPANNVASVSNFDPVLISLVRRAMPNLIAYDVCGVQPMNGPTGLIFAMKARYQGGSTSNREALFNEANTAFSASSFNTVELRKAALTPSNRIASTWSCIKAIKGEITTAQPGLINAGTW